MDDKEKQFSQMMASIANIDWHRADSPSRGLRSDLRQVWQAVDFSASRKDFAEGTGMPKLRTGVCN